MYPAGVKRTPRYATSLGDGALAPYDVLYFVASTAGVATRTAQVALHLLLTMDRATLTRPPGERGEEDEEEAAAARGSGYEGEWYEEEASEDGVATRDGGGRGDDAEEL